MITLYSEKTREEVIEIIKKHTRAVKIRHILSRRLLALNGDMVGNLRKKRSWLFLPDLSMLVLPYRYFFFKILNVDNMTVVSGKFKYHPRAYITYLIVYAVFAYKTYNINFRLFYSFLILYCLFAISAFVVGILFGRKYEKRTIEFIEKILAE